MDVMFRGRGSVLESYSRDRVCTRPPGACLVNGRLPRIWLPTGGSRPLSRKSLEKELERIGRLGRTLFREEMPCLQRTTPDIVAPLPPERERSTRLDIPAAQQAGATPQGQERALNATSACAVRVVVRSIE